MFSSESDLPANGGYLLQGKYVLTGAGRILERAAVAFDSRGLILAVGDPAELKERYPTFAPTGSLEESAVMPGLINSHHHGWGISPVQFGVVDDYLEPWLIKLGALPPVDPYLDTLWSAMRQVRAGVTTVQHSSFIRNPSTFDHEVTEAIRAYQELGMRATVAVQVRDRNSFVYQDDDSFLDSIPAGVASIVRAATAEMAWPDWPHARDLVSDLRRNLASAATLDVQVCAEGPEWCSVNLLEDIAEFSDALNVRVHMHCLESRYQPAYLQAEYQQPVIDQLKAIGLLTDRLSLAHSTWISPSELELVAEAGTSLCHCPSSNLRLRNGIFPLEEARDRGAIVSLGLDSNSLNDDDDMLQEMRLALRLHRMPVGEGFTWAPSATDILQMVLEGGSKAVGLHGQIGVLTEGAVADVLLIDLDGLEPVSTPHPAGFEEMLVNRGRPSNVRSVFIAGRPVLKEWSFEAVDEWLVRQELLGSAAKTPPPSYVRWRDAARELQPYVNDFYSRHPVMSRAARGAARFNHE